MFFRPFLAWLALGLIGAVSSTFLHDINNMNLGPGTQDLSPTVLRFLLMLQPAILLLITVSLGAALDHKTGLRSWLSERLRGQPSRFPAPLLPIAAGFALGFVAALADTAFFTWYSGTSEAGVKPHIAPILYGGITEELMLRYGLLTLFFWITAKLLRRPPGTPIGAPSAWIMIGLVALIFGALHLPVMAALMELTPALILRTILLNAVLGTLAGWLYWRRKLEAAMLAHMAFHPGLWAALWLIA